MFSQAKCVFFPVILTTEANTARCDSALESSTIVHLEFFTTPMIVYVRLPRSTGTDHDLAYPVANAHAYRKLSPLGLLSDLAVVWDSSYFAASGWQEK